MKNKQMLDLLETIQQSGDSQDRSWGYGTKSMDSSICHTRSDLLLVAHISVRPANTYTEGSSKIQFSFYVYVYLKDQVKCCSDYVTYIQLYAFSLEGHKRHVAILELGTSYRRRKSQIK